MNRWSRRAALVGGLGALVALPYVITPYLVSLVTLAMIVAMIATGVNLLAGQTGLVSIGHAGIAAAAGYGIAWAFLRGHGVGLQLFVGLVVGIVASLLYGLLTARTTGVVFLMVTLALGMVIYGLALKWTTVTRGQNGISGIARPSFVAEWWKYYFLVAAVFVLVTVAVRMIMRSPFGLVMKAIRDSEMRSASLGYSVIPIKIVAVFLSGIPAGIAGILGVWHAQFISPASASFGRSATSVVITIIGGVGSLFGPAVGAMIVVGTEHWLSSYITRWPTLLGAIFIVVVLFMPQGVTGAFRRLLRSEPDDDPVMVSLKRGGDE